MMRPVGIGLAVALMVASLASSGLAFAKAPAVEITKEQRQKGMAAAPGLITAGGYDCQLADARWLGDSSDPKTKSKMSIYELACTGNEGLIVIKSADPTPTAFTCLEADSPRPDGKPNSTSCALPGNADPKAGLAPYIAKAGVTCTPDKVRALGHSPTSTFFELACKEGGGGYIMSVSAPPRLDKPVELNPCIGYAEESNVKCELTSRADQLSMVDQLVSASGTACQIKDRAFIGAANSGVRYYEVACQDGKGYMIGQKPSGGLDKVIPCIDADAIGGGCKLTDTRQAKTEEAGLYSKLAKKAGFDCDVSGYAPLPNNVDNKGKEVVELACSNRPDGAVAVFAASSSDPSTIYDCAHSELAGYRCSLTKAPAAYGSLTADLKALNKNSCTVSNARAVGVTADKRGYIEVGCSDGLQGYMIEYSLSPLKPTSPIICNEAKGIAGGCTLPGNTGKKG